MDILQFFAELITSIFKHGLSLTTLAVSLTALLRVQGIRKILTKRLPRRFRHEDKLDVIQRDIKAIKEHLGVRGWDADYLNGKKEQHKITGRTTKLLSPLEAYVTAITARFCTRSTETYLYQQRRMNMKSKLLSRKFLMALATGILVVLNDGLDLGLKTDTIMYVVGIVATWIVGESAVDLSKKPQVSDVEKSYHSE